MPQEKKRKVASAQDGKPSSSSASSAEAGAVATDWDWSGKLVQNFLLTASPDLRQVWEMALSLSPKDPCAAFKSVGVTLCGPFDMMAGKLNAELATQRSIIANIHIRIFIAWLSSAMHATCTSSMQPVGGMSLSHGSQCRRRSTLQYVQHSYHSAHAQSLSIDSCTLGAMQYGALCAVVVTRAVCTRM